MEKVDNSLKDNVSNSLSDTHDSQSSSIDSLSNVHIEEEVADDRNQVADMRQQSLKHVFFMRLAALVSIFAILFVGIGITEMKDMFMKEFRYTATAEEGDKVYLDIIGFMPMYSIEDLEIHRVEKVVCLCYAPDYDGQVWMVMDTGDYVNVFGGGKLSSMWERMSGREAETVSDIVLSEVTRIHGKIKRANDIVGGLEDDIGTWRVIEFVSADID